LTPPLDIALLGMTFFLLFTRFTSFLVSVPLFGAPAVPVQWKIVLGAFLAGTTLLAAPLTIPNALLAAGISPSAGLDYNFLLMLITETAMGLLLSLVVTTIFSAFQFAGFMQGFQMGYTVANVVDPLSQDQVSVLGQFLFFMGMLIFLAMDGHHLALQGLVESVRIVPPGTMALTGPAVEVLIRMLQATMIAGMQIALPVIGTIFLVDLGLGVMARAVPNMNVFMVGLPLKAAVGMIIILISFSLTGAVMEMYLNTALDRWYWDLLPLLRG